MIKIAICDDEKELRQDLSQILSRSLDLRGIEYEILKFSCGEQLLAQAKRQGPDILFLDIEMDQMDGMTAAKELRKAGSRAVIIFITAYPDYVFQGYEVRALNYILKPYKEEKVLSVLYQALEELRVSADLYYVVRQKSGTIRLLLNDTRYFFSERRMITAVTGTGPVLFYGKLDDLELELPQFFVRIHNRYLVNLNYISAIEGNAVLCKEEQLPVSRARRQDLEIAFAKYILR
ncbi:LytTR family DNA-binding domain-containing protein [Anaerovorax odorimutans]|uniref:Stage 0 sporulation protein A homolog n=1 Tax=Anaerovorax odorimutans TaxID=109327 RepID=A0ABT1RSR9_9FIRM|nr:LytTR family DNA-binding domain-containing protein [Anaerovorax odorimutans]MCQ4638199.1 LytTR family DNA-binding domain-containing protein [Anaerovorax odorimutans]